MHVRFYPELLYWSLLSIEQEQHATKWYTSTTNIKFLLMHFEREYIWRCNNKQHGLTIRLRRMSMCAGESAEMVSFFVCLANALFEEFRISFGHSHLVLFLRFPSWLALFLFYIQDLISIITAMQCG